MMAIDTRSSQDTARPSVEEFKDAATLEREAEQAVSALGQRTDWPREIESAIARASRCLRPVLKDEYGGPEPDDLPAAEAIIAAVVAFQTEREMHNAWRKRGEEAESALARLQEKHDRLKEGIAKAQTVADAMFELSRCGSASSEKVLKWCFVGRSRLSREGDASMKISDSELVAGLLLEYSNELDTAACDRCDGCGKLSMCLGHSILSVLQRRLPLTDETIAALRAPR